MSYSVLKSRLDLFIDYPRSVITDEAYLELLDAEEELYAVFNFSDLIDELDNSDYVAENYLDPGDLRSTTPKAYEPILDEYFETIGNQSKIELYNTIDKQHAIYNTGTEDTTPVYLGGDFKDSGKFYYADIAYAVGFTRLTNIHSIQIDDEYYKIESITDDHGNPVQGISATGCTRYRFIRNVLPTYQVEIEMYIYPGTYDQPYCPTINKYHNFATSKYYGMFTKQDGEDVGVYVFKGYSPMTQEGEEVIQLGKMDLNSINFNDPTLDKKSYEAFLMTEIKNLTNSSTINGEPLSTEDFKYYMASKLVDPSLACNYPGLAIIEFKNFPIGSGLTFPKIKVLVDGEDPHLGGNQ
jgi:hypothetical protein